MSSSYRTLIVGCGKLGSRHLQAVASLPEVREIDVVDPSLQSLEEGKRLLQEVRRAADSLSPLPSPLTVRWHTQLAEAKKGGDLCIVATQAGGRRALVEEIVGTLGYGTFLLEKVVTQSVAEYQRLLHFSKERGLSAWVNCKGRAYPIHRWIKARLDSIDAAEPIIFCETSGNHGLANNGVHAADLFAFHDACGTIQNAGLSLDPILHPSKRGEGLFDLSGSLSGVSDKGSRIFLSMAAHHQNSGVMTILTSKFRWAIDHVQEWAYESDVGDGGEWKRIPFEGNLLVSHMTRAFAEDILKRGHCQLPTLEECFPAHQFILNGLLLTFNRLLNKNSDECPVT